MDRAQVNHILYGYYGLQDAIKEKKNKITEIKSIIETIETSFSMPAGINNDGMPHAHNASSDGILNSIMKKDEQIERLTSQIEKAQADILKYTQLYAVITEVLIDLPADEKEIFIKTYRDKETRINIAYDMGFATIKAVKIRKAKIIDKMKDKFEELDVA